MTMQKRPTYRTVVAGVPNLTGEMKYTVDVGALYMALCPRVAGACATLEDADPAGSKAPQTELPKSSRACGHYIR
jgi:hypothetical protein